MKLKLFLSVVMGVCTLISYSANIAADQPQAKAKTNDNQMTKVELQTSLGNIVVELYNETPQHRDNFIKLVKEGYYDGVLFHRVIKDFMIQTGDGNSKTAGPNDMLGDGDPGYTIPAEFVYPKYFHKRGALAAARTGDQVNPERRSSGSQFYIVTGKIYGSDELKMMTQRMADMRKQDIFRRLVTENHERIQALQEAQDQAGILDLQNELIQLTEAEAAKAPFSLNKILPEGMCGAVEKEDVGILHLLHNLIIHLGRTVHPSVRIDPDVPVAHDGLHQRTEGIPHHGYRLQRNASVSCPMVTDDVKMRLPSLCGMLSSPLMAYPDIKVNVIRTGNRVSRIIIRKRPVLPACLLSW